MKLRILAATAALCLALAPQARAQVGPDSAAPAPSSPLRIDINIPENRLRLYDGDSLVKIYRVSVGMPGHDTPDGVFSIAQAEWNPWWRPPQGREWARDDRVTPPGPNNPMGRVKLFFAPLYYIHGSPHVRELGTPASHGCVRMMNRDVIELARTIHARSGGSLSQQQITAVLARPTQNRWARIASPVPLTIRYDPIVVRGDTLRIFPDVYERSRIHTEGVIQALIAAGYEVDSIDRADVRRVLATAAQAKGTYAVALSDAFDGLRAARRESGAGR